jgi:Kef-type K+ transport system membrane component KefB
MWGYLALLSRSTSHRFVSGLHCGNAWVHGFMAVLLFVIAILIGTNDDDDNNNSGGVVVLVVLGIIFLFAAMFFGYLFRNKKAEIRAYEENIAAQNGGVLPYGVQHIYVG